MVVHVHIVAEESLCFCQFMFNLNEKRGNERVKAVYVTTPLICR